MPDPAHRRMEIYLNDHLLGASAGTRLARRTADAERGKPFGRELDAIATEIAEDYAALQEIMRQVGVTPRRTYALVGRVGEYVGRYKPNGRVLRSSQLRTLVELEAMRMGVVGKMQGWAALAVAAEGDSRLDRVRLRSLLDRAKRQAEALETMRLTAARMLASPDALPAPQGTSTGAAAPGAH